jgi:hypothetical protein
LGQCGRFIQQYEVGLGDYTQERYQFLPDWDAQTLVRKARERLLVEIIGCALRCSIARTCIAGRIMPDF